MLYEVRFDTEAIYVDAKNESEAAELAVFQLDGDTAMMPESVRPVGDIINEGCHILENGGYPFLEK